MKAELEFTPLGWSYKKDYSLKGYVYDSDGKKVLRLNGSWIKEIKAYEIDSNEEFILATKKPLPDNHK